TARPFPRSISRRSRCPSTSASRVCCTCTGTCPASSRTSTSASRAPASTSRRSTCRRPRSSATSSSTPTPTRAGWRSTSCARSRARSAAASSTERRRTPMKEVPLQRPGRSAPAAAPAVPAFALWQLGFRPFYLLAAAFAAIHVALWALQFGGTIGRPLLAGPLWHGHEMIFGYALAVIAGFLLTAVRNWTGRPTPTGAALALLAALWLLGRVLVLGPWPLAAAVVNAAFPVAVAIAIGGPIVRARNTRNYFF